MHGWATTPSCTAKAGSDEDDDGEAITPSGRSAAFSAGFFGALPSRDAAVPVAPLAPAAVPCFTPLPAAAAAESGTVEELLAQPDRCSTAAALCSSSFAIAPVPGRANKELSRGATAVSQWPVVVVPKDEFIKLQMLSSGRPSSESVPFGPLPSARPRSSSSSWRTMLPPASLEAPSNRDRRELSMPTSPANDTADRSESRSTLELPVTKFAIEEQKQYAQLTNKGTEDAVDSGGSDSLSFKSLDEVDHELTRMTVDEQREYAQLSSEGLENSLDEVGHISSLLFDEIIREVELQELQEHLEGMLVKAERAGESTMAEPSCGGGGAARRIDDCRTKYVGSMVALRIDECRTKHLGCMVALGWAAGVVAAVVVLRVGRR